MAFCELSFHSHHESTHWFFELHSSEKLTGELCSLFGSVTVATEMLCLPVEQGRFPVRLIRDSSKLLVAPIPSDDERDQVECLLPKCVLIIVAKSKENASFSVLHGRFIAIPISISVM